MLWLARAKRRIGEALGSRALIADAKQTARLLVPLGRDAHRARPQRRLRMVVGRPAGRARHRRAPGARGRRGAPGRGRRLTRRRTGPVPPARPVVVPGRPRCPTVDPGSPSSADDAQRTATAGSSHPSEPPWTFGTTWSTSVAGRPQGRASAARFHWHAGCRSSCCARRLCQSAPYPRCVVVPPPQATQRPGRDVTRRQPGQGWAVTARPAPRARGGRGPCPGRTPRRG